MEIETLQTLELLILFFDIELAQMKLDELVEDVMNLDTSTKNLWMIIVVIVKISLLLAQILLILILSNCRVPSILYFH